MVSAPEPARVGSARLLLLFEMMLCFGRGPSCEMLLGFSCGVLITHTIFTQRVNTGWGESCLPPLGHLYMNPMRCVRGVLLFLFVRFGLPETVFR